MVYEPQFQIPSRSDLNRKRLRKTNCENSILLPQQINISIESLISPSKRSRRSTPELDETNYQYVLTSTNPTLSFQPKCKSCGSTGHLRTNSLKCKNNPKYSRMAIIQENMANLFFKLLTDSFSY